MAAFAIEAKNLSAAARLVGNAPALLARGLIRVYRYTLSSFVGRTCRHLPTCSEYADIAIGRFGLWRGGWMALARFCALPAARHARFRSGAGNLAWRRSLV